MAQNDENREARKQYMRRRQSIVFSIIGAFLAVALVISCLFFFHVGGLGEKAVAADQPNYGLTAPCATAAKDQPKPKYMDNKSVTIRVLNGTKFTGFAQAVAQALEKREFVVQGVDNYHDAKVERTTIVFGKNAIPEAYTLAANFNDAKMKMDDRNDKLVDVIVGATFENLVPENEVPKTGKEIVSLEGCKAPDKMTKLPKAEEHQPVG